MRRSYSVMLLLVIAAVFIIPVQAHPEELIIASDSDVQWSSDGFNWYDAVECWIAPRWPMITGATWIWRTEYTDAAWEYNNLPEGGWYFRRIFNLENVPAMAQIEITADNSYRLHVNGAYIGGDGPMNRDGPQHEEWRSIETYDISNALVKGQNTILIRTLNCWESDNPAGLIFKATLTYAPDYVIPEFPFGTITVLITGILSLLTLRFTRAHGID